jgi:hypothetical protein
VKSIYITTVQVHEVPLSLVANDGGEWDNLEDNFDGRGEIVFARQYTGVHTSALEAGAMPNEWEGVLSDEPIVGISLTEVSRYAVYENE